MPGKVFLDLGGGRGKRRAVAVAIALGVAATGVEAKQAGEEAVEPGAGPGRTGHSRGARGRSLNLNLVKRSTGRICL